MWKHKQLDKNQKHPKVTIQEELTKKTLNRILLGNREGETALKFKKEIKLHLFYYLFASWGLEPEDRQLIAKSLQIEIKNNLRLISDDEKPLRFSSEQLDKLSAKLWRNLTSEQKYNENDIFVRRLFLHFIEAHQQLYTRFLYVFPEEEHKKIVTQSLDLLLQQQEITKTQKISILSKTNQVKSEFITDIEAYKLLEGFPTKNDMKKIWLVLLLALFTMKSHFHIIASICEFIFSTLQIDKNEPITFFPILLIVAFSVRYIGLKSTNFRESPASLHRLIIYFP